MVVVDDQAVVRDGLVALLGTTAGVRVLGAAGDGAAAVALVARLDPDVVLMDLRMPRCDGIEATRRIRAAHPGVQVVVLTTYADDESIFAALEAGARGYLTKDATAAEIAAALRTVTAGRALLDPTVQQRVVDALARTTPTRAAPTRATPARPDAPARRGRIVGRPSARPDPPATTDAATAAGSPAGLTPRETQVLVLIAAGLSNPEIAAALVVTEATVKTHINHLLAKTGQRDRAQAVAYAYQHGLAQPG